MKVAICDDDKIQIEIIKENVNKYGIENNIDMDIYTYVSGEQLLNYKYIYDIVFVDTAGFSHKNAAQCEEMKKLIDGVDEVFEKETYLVLSATTKYKDLVDIVNIYNDIAKYKIIFTKLDETTTYGNLLNIKLYSGADLSYTTNGQNVPDDIELFDTQKIVKQLLGGTK